MHWEVILIKWKKGIKLSNKEREGDMPRVNERKMSCFSHFINESIDFPYHLLSQSLQVETTILYFLYYHTYIRLLHLVSYLFLLQSESSWEHRGGFIPLDNPVPWYHVRYMGGVQCCWLNGHKGICKDKQLKSIVVLIIHNINKMNSILKSECPW